MTYDSVTKTVSEDKTETTTRKYSKAQALRVKAGLVKELQFINNVLAQFPAE